MRAWQIAVAAAPQPPCRHVALHPPQFGWDGEAAAGSAAGGSPNGAGQRA